MGSTTNASALALLLEKATPGPWRVGKRYPGRVMSQYEVVAQTTQPANEGTETEHEKADARLIAISGSHFGEMVGLLDLALDATEDADTQEVGGLPLDEARAAIRALLAVLEEEAGR